MIQIRSKMPAPSATRRGLLHICSTTVFLCLTAFCPCVVRADDAENEFEQGVLIRLEGEIVPQLQEYMLRKLSAAKDSGADLVVLEIDSPGGYLDVSMQMAEHLRDKIDWAHTVAYIPRQALSGGAVVALGCDDIVMGPRALIGDAGPIRHDAADNAFRHAPEKVLSHLAPWMRTLAEAKGRPPALAESMVDRSKEVYQLTNKQTGEVKFVLDDELGDLKDRDDWNEEKVQESKKDRFFESNGTRAVELQLATAVVEDREELQQMYGLQEPFAIYEDNWVDRAVYVLNLPAITIFLFVVGLVALYMELSAPGLGVGGLIALLCFALFFWSRFFGGTSGWLEVILFVSGVLFLLAEIFVIPGTGFAGITGLALIIVGLVMANQRGFIPSTGREWSTLGTSVFTVFASGVAFIVIAIFLSRHLRSLPVFRRLVLSPPPEAVPAESNADPKKVGATASAYEVSVGDWGTAETPLRPAGKVRFEDEFVDVVTDGSFVEAGQQVRVLKVSGNRIVVREVESD